MFLSISLCQRVYDDITNENYEKHNYEYLITRMKLGNSLDFRTSHSTTNIPSF